MVGKTLGQYEIHESLGAGGMGEVYRAHDPNLKRDVAIKVLPELLADDPDRLARLEREAHSLAALNHPNVATIHGLESADGIRFLVLELVDGGTLEERIARGPMPIDEALGIAVQIAEGLEAAHAAGIIHRDLKPANVKITPQGRVKVLDFGLAKPTPEPGAASGSDAGSAPLTHSPTIAVGVTEAGVLLGTAPYMSPEQIKGKAIDKRADVWAFGCVLYEMLTSARPFEGDDVTEVLASILKEEPEWDALPPRTPVAIQMLLRRCLRKDVNRRLQDIADARIDIEDTISEPDDVVPATMSLSPWGAWEGFLAPGILAVVVGIALGAAARPWIWPPEVAEDAGVIRSTVLLGISPAPTDLAISPDGTRIVFVADLGDGSKLYVRSLDDWDVHPIAGTEGGRDVFMSPDGERVGYVDADNQLTTAPVDSGVGPRRLAAVGASGSGLAAWGPDDTIIFRLPDAAGLGRIPSDGSGPVVQLTEAGPTGTHADPSFLPDGSGFIYVQQAGNAGNGPIRVERFDGTGGVTLPVNGRKPRYLPTGHILFYLARQLYVLPFDIDRLEPISAASDPVLSNLESGVGLGVADNGTLVYVPGTPRVRELLTVDMQGVRTVLGLTPANYLFPRIAPDGDRIAIVLVDAQPLPIPSGMEIFVYDRRTGNRRLVSSFEYAGATWAPIFAAPEWRPDGRYLAFAARSDATRDFEVDLFLAPADGGQIEPLLQRPGDQRPLKWARAGQSLLFAEGGYGRRTVWDLPLDPAGDPIPVIGESSLIAYPSPDWQWLAYRTPDGVRVKGYDEPGRGRLVSPRGGTEPIWAPDGQRLYFRLQDGVMAVDITTDPEFEVGAPRRVLDATFWENSGVDRYMDIAPNGDWFVMLRDVPAPAPLNGLMVVQNWFEELRQLRSGDR